MSLKNFDFKSKKSSDKTLNYLTSCGAEPYYLLYTISDITWFSS